MPDIIDGGTDIFVYDPFQDTFTHWQRVTDRVQSTPIVVTSAGVMVMSHVIPRIIDEGDE